MYIQEQKKAGMNVVSILENKRKYTSHVFEIVNQVGVNGKEVGERHLQGVGIGGRQAGREGEGAGPKL